jgi:hypothetical protein
MKLNRTVLAAFAVASLAVVTGAAVAVAADPSPVSPGGPAGRTVCRPERDAVDKAPTLEQLKDFGNCEIDRRVKTLDMLATRIADAGFATADHKTALSGEVGRTKSGLLSLKTKIGAETDIAALKIEVRQIATDFRVYALVAPKVNLVLGADRVAAADRLFGDIDKRLSDAIAKAEAAGKDVTDARAHLASMNAAVDKAIALAAPIAPAVLPLTPAQFNAGTAGPILTDARSKLASARQQLKTAQAEAKACRDALAKLRDTAAASPSA